MQTYSNARNTYSVDILWEIAPEPIVKPIIGLLKAMDERIWGEDNLTPNEVIKAKIGPHWERSINSDLSYPIIVTPNGWIADGNHRIIKAIIKGRKTIKVRQFKSFKDMMPAIVHKQ